MSRRWAPGTGIASRAMTTRDGVSGLSLWLARMLSRVKRTTPSLKKKPLASEAKISIDCKSSTNAGLGGWSAMAGFLSVDETLNGGRIQGSVPILIARAQQRGLRRRGGWERGFALPLGQRREHLDLGVEAGQVAAVGGEQRLELRHFLGIEADRGHAGVVGPLREPGIIRGRPAPSLLEQRVLRAHRSERGSLGLELGGVIAVAAVDGGEFCPGAFDERREVFAIALALVELTLELRIVLRGKPAPDTLLLDRHRERFVEHRVVLGIGNLVRELVENEARDLEVRIAQEGRRHRIVEVAERRVRRDPADVHVVAR